MRASCASPSSHFRGSSRCERGGTRHSRARPCPRLAYACVEGPVVRCEQRTFRETLFTIHRFGLRNLVNTPDRCGLRVGV